MTWKNISIIPAGLVLAACYAISSGAQTTNQQNVNRGAYTTSVPATNDPAANPGAATTTPGNSASAVGTTNSGYGRDSDSNEPNRNNWSWIGLLGLGGLFGLAGRRETVRRHGNQEVRQGV